MKQLPSAAHSSEDRRPSNRFPKNVAVLRALQLGDLLCAVPCFRALKRAWPEATVTLVGLPWSTSFVERFSRYLDGFYEFPGFENLPERRFDPGRMRAFVARGMSFDLAIQLQGNGSVTNRFLPRLHSHFSAGFFPSGEPCPDPARFIAYPEDEHEIRRLLKLIEHLGIPLAGEDLEFPLTEADYHEANEIATPAGLRTAGFVCLHPGARDPARRWPLEDFAEVGEALIAGGIRLVLTGTSEESDQTAALRARLGSACLDLAGKTSLGGLAALLKRARLLVSNDTGVSHLAAALRVPSVVVFSGSDPRRWAPLDTHRHRALGNPLANPPVQVTPAAVLDQAFALLSEAPLRIEVRGGGFPVLPPINWTRVRRLLLIYDGSEDDVVLLGPAIEVLHSRWPTLALLTSPAGAPVAGLFPGIEPLLVADQQSLGEQVAEAPVRRLVQQLRECSFDASIIFTRPAQSPYTAAYICYLAGIPLRIAASREFGGALLSHWVRKLPEVTHPIERHLALLRAVALPWQPRGAGICVPADVETRVRADVHSTSIDPGDGQILLDIAGMDQLAGPLRHFSGMRVIHPADIESMSRAELAALVRLSDLVVTASPLTARIADAFGRRLIATGAAAASSDGWRPLRTVAKLLEGANTSEEQLLEAASTLLWLPAPKAQAEPARDISVNVAGCRLHVAIDAR